MRIAPTIVAGLLLLSTTAAHPAEGSPQGWNSAPDATIEAMLPELAPDQLLVVVVTAGEWCQACQELKKDVLTTPALADLVLHDRGLTIEYDSPYGQAVKAKYGVIGLPTTFVLDAEGVEVARLMGYHERAEYLESLRDRVVAGVGASDVAKLAARLERHPEDAALRLELALVRLLRGDPASVRQALDALDLLVAAPSRYLDDWALAAHAARVKGRYLHKTRGDFAAAAKHYAAMVERFAGRPEQADFEARRADAEAALVERSAEPRDDAP